MLRDRLVLKGWSEDELDQLALRYNPVPESAFVVMCAVFLSSIAIVGVPVLYAMLLTFYLPLVSELLSAVMMVLAIPLGALFAILLVDFDRLQRHHHMVFLIVFPCSLLLLSSYVFAYALPSQNALIASVLYAVTFALPYAIIVSKQWNFRIGRASL